jgi:hypothetical protein
MTEFVIPKKKKEYLLKLGNAKRKRNVHSPDELMTLRRLVFF